MQTVTNQTATVQRNAMQLIQIIAQRPLTIISILVVLFAQDWFSPLCHSSSSRPASWQSFVSANGCVKAARVRYMIPEN